MHILHMDLSRANTRRPDAHRGKTVAELRRMIEEEAARQPKTVTITLKVSEEVRDLWARFCTDRAIQEYAGNRNESVIFERLLLEWYSVIPSLSQE